METCTEVSMSSRAFPGEFVGKRGHSAKTWRWTRFLDYMGHINECMYESMKEGTEQTKKRTNQRMNNQRMNEWTNESWNGPKQETPSCKHEGDSANWMSMVCYFIFLSVVN